MQQFAIGDEFHIDFRDGHITGPNVLTGQVIYKIVSKNNSSSGDSMFYYVERCARYDQSNMDGHVYYTKHDTLNWNYELNATVGGCEDQYPYHMFNGNDHRYTMTVDVLGNVEVFINGDALYRESDSCINQMMVGGGNYSIIKTGFPRLNFGSGLSYDQTERFVYYKKGDRTWGTPLDCDKFLAVDDVLMNSAVKLVPNPCAKNENVRIEGVSNLSEAVILDLSGRVIATQASAKAMNYVETSQLNIGLYIVKLKLKNGDVVSVQLLVK